MQDIGVIILAGGKSSRMNSDKGLLTLNKQTFIEIIYNTAKEVSNDITIVCNKPNYPEFENAIFVKDDFIEKGPLSGLYSGLMASKSKYNIVLSCDIPLIKTDILNNLITNIENNDVVISKYKDKTHPLIAIYSKNIIPNVKNAIENKQLRLMEFVKSSKFTVVDFSAKIELENCFTNINTKEDYSNLINGKSKN
jgi:molybdenum cofactor guanylyltransferase